MTLVRIANYTTGQALAKRRCEGSEAVTHPSSQIPSLPAAPYNER
jgi:hypothetical protein